MDLPTLGNAANSSCEDDTIKFVGVMSHMAEICNKACPVGKAYDVMVECIRDMEMKVYNAIREDEANKRKEEGETNSKETVHDPPMSGRKGTKRGDRLMPGSEKNKRLTK